MNNTSFDDIKKQAINIYQGNKKISCPIFGEVRLTPEWFEHIEWKKKNHKRNPDDAFVRYVCFIHVKDILEKSHYYQEYRETSEIIKVKRNGKIISEQKIVRYFAFVAVVNNNKNRVKVLVKKVDGWKHYDFVSIIPSWKSKWYNQIFFLQKDEDQETIDSSQHLVDLYTKNNDDDLNSWNINMIENENEENEKTIQNMDDFQDKVCTEWDILNREIGTNPQTSVT